MRGYRLVNPTGSRRMDECKSDQLSPQDQTTSQLDNLTSPAVSAAAAAPEPAKIEATVASQPESVAASASAATLAIADPVAPRLDGVRPPDGKADETIAPSLQSGWTPSPSWARRLAPLAAT